MIVGLGLVILVKMIVGAMLTRVLMVVHADIPCVEMIMSMLMFVLVSVCVRVLMDVGVIAVSMFMAV
jgi:hypothetical protein